MKISKNSSGFSVIEVTILIVVLLGVGFAGWYVFKNNTDTEQTTTTKSSATESRPETQEATGACNALEQLTEPISFTCNNAAWTNASPDDELEDFRFDFTSKKDSSVRLALSASSLNSQYGADPTLCTVVEVRELTVKNYGTLYLVKAGSQDADGAWFYKVGLSDKKPTVAAGTDYECVPPPFTFEGKTKDKQTNETVIIKTSANTSSAERNDTGAFTSPAMLEAIEFLSSVSYK